jgi:hypothetical protein
MNLHRHVKLKYSHRYDVCSGIQTRLIPFCTDRPPRELPNKAKRNQSTSKIPKCITSFYQNQLPLYTEIHPRSRSGAISVRLAL